MNIYISGISGTGMGPLALMAKDAGLDVSGSDLEAGAILPELEKAKIDTKIGPQTGEFLAKKIAEQKVDWFVHTSALPKDHPELQLARKHGLKITKRDDLTAFLIDKLHLKLVAVAGTHGKTTTTSMIVYASLKLKLPISYIVGTTLPFAKSGAYKKGDKFFIYEADEYDKNFLKFHPWLAVIPAVSYDHPDIYPTKKSYLAAFKKFESQSKTVIKSGIDYDKLTLAGSIRRYNASLAAAAITKMAPRVSAQGLINVLNKFPGASRRFEKISDGVYSDYAHHPEEIAATIDIAKDEAQKLGKKGIVVIYEPHQNTRQHEIKSDYAHTFLGADQIFWLPTYLTRENEKLKIITPTDFIKTLKNHQNAHSAKLTPAFATKLKNYQKSGYLILLMTAGPSDAWLRQHFA